MKRLIVIALQYVLLYLLTISANLLIYRFFDTEVTYLEILFFNILINLLTTTNFCLLFVEYFSISL